MSNYMERMKAKSKDSKSVLQTLQEMESNGVGEENKPELLENKDRVKNKDSENVHKKAVKEPKISKAVETDEKVIYEKTEELLTKKEMEKDELSQKKESQKIKASVIEQTEEEQEVEKNYSTEAGIAVISLPTELIGEVEGTNTVILDRETALQNLQSRIFVKPNYTSNTSINLVTEYYVFLSTRAAQLKLTTNMYFHILLNEDRFYRETTGDHEPIFEQVMYKYKGNRAHKNISFAEEDRKYFIEESARLGIKYTVFAHYLIEKEMDREKWKGKRKIGEIILRKE